MTAAKRQRIVLPILALCTLVLCGACRQQSAEEVETTSAVPVTTAAAARGTIRGIVHATGVIGLAPGAELIVIAPEAARIAEIPRATGDRVRAGDVLVRFEIPSAAADAQRQQAEVGRAEAGLANAKAAQTRAGELFDRGVAARKEVEDADRALADAEAALVQARASLDAARSVAQRSVVRATFNGIVAERAHNAGDLVEAAASDPVLRVIDPERLEVVASIPLGEAARVKVGAPGRLVNASAGSPDVAVTVVSPPTAVDAGTATVPVRLRFAHPVAIPVGSPVQVEIEAEEHRDVVIVPAAAIVREGADASTFVASDGTAHRRSVQVGLTDGPHVEVSSGVSAGDRVIIDGQAGLPDGAPITEKPASAETPSAGPSTEDTPR